MDQSMYHPSFPRGAQIYLIVGFWCTMTFVPGGENGVALKSNWPWSWACAERVGCILDGRRRFNVATAWGNRRHHKRRGESLCVDTIPEMKWFLKVCIALSAVFCRCRCGSTSWKFSFSSSMYSFKTLEHSLYNTCIFGVSPLLHSNFRIAWYAFLMWRLVLDFSGSTKILLES